MLKIGVTGQHGFIGQHLYQTIGLYPKEFERIDFKREFFEQDNLLNNFVSQCDVIIHLAAKNRHNDANVIYDTNLILVNKLVKALNAVNSKAHVFFSSSSQEEKDNEYGRSKKEGREIFIEWAKLSGGKFTGMVIPNVFGPFGHPYYNSFIATFSYQLTHDEQPEIKVDGSVKLIYVTDLIKIIIQKIGEGISYNILIVANTYEYKVSEILKLLENYKQKYFMAGAIPELKTPFEINLFNTFRGYIDNKNHFPIKLKNNTDTRGTFVEVIHLNSGGQVSFSTTVPGITRGNHFHTHKIERFAVIKGKATIQMRKIGTDETLNFELDGNNPAYVDMPIWYTHNITNIGQEDLYTIFWINEFFDPSDPDTYMEVV
jgi:UDP-2-acetamido-2,6-beta-L-arabino-hexul-4-ose reductase